MSIIGNFTKEENGAFKGNIETLTLNVPRVSFEPLTKRGDKTPDYRIFAGLTEIGAAWKHSGEKGEHLSARIDDPNFAAPITCRLTKTGAEHGYSLIWERDRKRS